MTLKLPNPRAIISTYEVFIFDLWGVVHNGQQPFSEALTLMEELVCQGKGLFLLSNSPRLAAPMAERLAVMGISADLYQGIYTSGGDCHLALKQRVTSFYQNLGQRLYHLGPKIYAPLFESLDYQLVTTLEQADFLLLTGTEKWIKTLADYQPLLAAALSRNLPLVCANADKQVIYGKERVLCAGLLSDAYGQQVGKVQLHGKPDPQMYQAVHHLAEQHQNRFIPKDKILMVGDSLATDIKGANVYGIDSLMLLTGVHGTDLTLLWDKEDDFKKKAESLFGIYGARPTYVAVGC